MSQELSARERADKYGLKNVSEQASLRDYLSNVLSRKDFTRELANARSTAAYSDSFFGRLWQVITPLLNAGIYYFIFGVLLNTKRGIDNYTAFLIAGVFAFNYMQATATACAAVINRNRKLIAAIPFPKLVLPISTMIQQTQQYFVSLGVLLVIVLATGEPITWMWLTLIPVIALQIIFTAGLSLIFARWGAFSKDINQVLPFVMRAWRYISGVFFSIAVFTKDAHSVIGQILKYNPGAVYLDLIRDSLITSQQESATLWIYGFGWAILFFVTGVIYFHRGERKYA